MDFQHYNESDLLLSGVLSHLKTIPYTEKNKEWQEWNLKVFKAVFGGGTTNPTILAIRDVSLRFLVENIDFFDLDGEYLKLDRESREDQIRNNNFAKFNFFKALSLTVRGKFDPKAFAFDYNENFDKFMAKQVVYENKEAAFNPYWLAITNRGDLVTKINVVGQIKTMTHVVLKFLSGKFGDNKPIENLVRTFALHDPSFEDAFVVLADKASANKKLKMEDWLDWLFKEQPIDKLMKLSKLLQEGKHVLSANIYSELESAIEYHLFLQCNKEGAVGYTDKTGNEAIPERLHKKLKV